MAQVDEEATTYLEQVAAKLQAEGVEQVRCELLHGDAGETLTEFAQTIPNNLVVMSTHGRSGIGRWVLGSVTDRVVRQSGDPVLVIRAN